MGSKDNNRTTSILRIIAALLPALLRLIFRKGKRRPPKGPRPEPPEPKPL